MFDEHRPQEPCYLFQRQLPFETELLGRTASSMVEYHGRKRTRTLTIPQKATQPKCTAPNDDLFAECAKGNSVRRSRWRLVTQRPIGTIVASQTP